MIPDFERMFRNPPAFGVPVTLQNIGKSFGGRRVLRGFDLHIEPGQFIAIVGRSGCGKSTLLRLIAGLETADRGQTSYGPRRGAPQQFVRVMYQEPRLLPWARVRANVEIGLGQERKSEDGRERAMTALTAMGLGDRLNAWPAELSGGQKQRVAFARALVSCPRLLAFDEPLGALDALTRIEMQQLLEKTWRQESFTAILVTHDVAEAITLADRVVIMQDGVASQDIPVCLARPRARGTPEFAALEARILRHLLGDPAELSPSDNRGDCASPAGPNIHERNAA